MTQLNNSDKLAKASATTFLKALSLTPRPNKTRRTTCHMQTLPKITMAAVNTPVLIALRVKIRRMLSHPLTQTMKLFVISPRL